MPMPTHTPLRKKEEKKEQDKAITYIIRNIYGTSNPPEEDRAAGLDLHGEQSYQLPSGSIHAVTPAGRSSAREQGGLRFTCLSDEPPLQTGRETERR